MSEFLGTLQKLIEMHQPVLILLDCLYWSHDKKENDSSEMKELMRQLVEIRDAYKVTVLVVPIPKRAHVMRRCIMIICAVQASLPVRRIQC